MSTAVARKKLPPVSQEDFKLNPDEVYFVEEPVRGANGNPVELKEALTSKDIYLCLARSRQLGPGTKVRRRSDGAVLALRSKEPAVGDRD